MHGCSWVQQEQDLRQDCETGKKAKEKAAKVCSKFLSFLAPVVGVPLLSGDDELCT